MSDYIDFGKGHTTVVGTTQMGKTYAVHRSVEQLSNGILFFNVQQIEVSNKFLDADGSDDSEVIIAALRKGKKINFIPDRENRWKQLKAIVKVLYRAAERQPLDIYIIVDECHLADRDALAACREIATTGIRWGIKAIYISQRPALMDNTLMTQSMRFVFFRTGMEDKYLDGHGFPAAQINERIKAGGQYAYVVWDFNELKGAYKV